MQQPTDRTRRGRGEFAAAPHASAAPGGVGRVYLAEDDARCIAARGCISRLFAAPSPEECLGSLDFSERSLSSYIEDVRRARGLGRSEVIGSSGLSPSFAYQVFKGQRRIGRDRALMMAFGLGCDVWEAQQLLRIAGRAMLWTKSRRDAIIMYCLEKGLSRVGCDDELYRLGEPTLLPPG